MTSIVFGKKWNWLTHSPVGPLSLDQARRRHDTGQPFVIAFRDEQTGQPEVVVETVLSGERCTVSFGDARGRVVESVSYSEEPGGTLFAHQVARYAYASESTSPLGGELLLFREDGFFAREVSRERGVIARHEGAFEAGRNRVKKPSGADVVELVAATRQLLQGTPGGGTA